MAATPKTRLITQKEFARRIGKSPQYVNKLVLQGKIELTKGLVDPKRAEKTMAVFQRPGAAKRTAKAGGRAKKKTGRPVPRKAKARTPKAHPEPKRPSATRSAASARADREYWLSLQAKLDYEKDLKLVLPAAEVIEAMRRQNANIRMRFRRLGRSMAPLLARIQSAAEIEQVLTEEIDLRLEELAADPLGTMAHEAGAHEEEAVQTFAEVPAAMLPPVEGTQIQEGQL